MYVYVWLIKTIIIKPLILSVVIYLIAFMLLVAKVVYPIYKKKRKPADGDEILRSSSGAQRTAYVPCS